MCETQWDALAIIKLRKQNFSEEIHCLCTRVFIRNKEEKYQPVGDSPEELLPSTRGSGTELPLRNKLKSDTENEPVSCYCSASHTDTLSTDEHDSLRESLEGKPLLKSLHSSDSGADLTDLTRQDAFPDWQKYWTLNGEKLIWESWIAKYSAYINPEYLCYSGETSAQSNADINPRSDLARNQPSKFCFEDNELKNYHIETTKFLQRDLSGSDEIINNDISEGWNPLSPVSVDCETEIEQLLGPRCGSYNSGSVRTVDSMTNVTRMTVSSIDFNKSPSDSLSSVSSVESSVSSTSSEGGEEDNENRWNYLWKKHYEEEYLLHYDKFMTSREYNNKIEPSFKSPRNPNQHNIFLSKHLHRIEHSKSTKDNLESSCIETIISKLKMTEEPTDTSELSEAHADEETIQMMALGLPVSFGKSNRETSEACTDNTKRLSPEEISFNSSRNKVRAAFNLLGVEFCEGSGDLMGGEVDYKMKHIRLQNRLLRLRPDSKRPKHTYFDEEGNQILENTEESNEENYQSILSDCSGNELSSAEEDDTTTDQAIIQKRNGEKTDDVISTKKRKRKKKISYPPEIKENTKLKKFWKRRFSLFNRFDEGIKLDEESWYSVTPEAIAKHTAERCRADIIIDAFCGAGGNTIQFALTCKRVIAIDIDPKKIDLAKHNAEVYGVADKIEFIVGDFLKLAPKLKADVVFMSPPWGGPSYVNKSMYDLEEMLQPVPFSKLMEAVKTVSKNVALFLPKNSNTYDVMKHAGENGFVEIEQNFINKNLIAITVYYNDLIQKI